MERGEVEFDFDALGGRFGWFARADNEAQERRTPFDRPTLSQILQLVPFVWRYTLFWIRNVFDRERIFIDIFRPFHHYPYNALPCGAIGSGSIGRDFRGAFCKFNLRPGLVQQHSEPIKADQFILTLMSAEGVLVRQTVLSAVTSFAASDDLSSWDFSLSPKDVTYRALYPRAWTKFELPEEKVVVLMRQISPVLPRDYKNASLPCTLFTFRVLNNSERALNGQRRSAAQTYSGRKKRRASSYINLCPECLAPLHWGPFAVQIGNSLKLLRNRKITVLLESHWHYTQKWRRVVRLTMRRKWHLHSFGICLLFTLAAENALFKNGILNFLMLPSRAKWEAEIEKWQRPIMEDQALPDWFKSALFNELYFLTDGGSVWFCYDPQWRQQEPQLSEYSARQFSRFGRFAYLESWEYRMFNTYDVHFYASFALGQLFPQLEHSIQAEFNDQVEHFNPKSVKYHMSGICSPVKARNRVPHDLGNPAEEPWLKTNAYRMHDTSEWKDLNLKFVLCAYRTFCSVLGRDRQFLSQVWPQVQIVVNEGLEHWDTDCDGMIENFGTADQTYDAWKMRGVSAYCGSLWLAALRVAVAMAEEMELPKLAEDYRAILERAKEVFMSKLWNGRYFNFDECSDEIMADQLCGYWFLHSIDPKMADQILPTAYVDSTLDTIFEFNVDKFSGGTLGAVNGMCRNGKVASSLQADEVWVGTNYALASLFIQRGHFSRGFKIARGPFVACYHRLGLQFQTPEALYQHRFYRAIGYMRPLSIWAIYCALRTAKLGQREMDNPNGRLTN
uniref:Non-lysosomal glucosylceramidase n=1 Tax=Globodera rostochiensis TaxID=31243 RepID=A0A914GQL3_GLORO